MKKMPEIFLSSQYLKTRTKDIQKNTKVFFKEDQALIEKMFILQAELANHSSFVFNPGLEFIKDTTPILLSAFYKNLVCLYAASDLTNKGLYGPARSLIRYVFEFLILSKYCELKNDEKLVKKWNSGDSSINLTNDVLNKIKKPDVEEFKYFWKSLCHYSHSSIFSMQLSFDWNKEIKTEMRLTYVLIRAMLEMNYHLLNTYILDKKIHYFVSAYAPNVTHKLKEAKIAMRELSKSNKKDFTPKAKLLIKNYKLKWSFVS